MKVGIVVPHIFMQRDILPSVIFAPAQLALDLAAGVQQQGADVTLFTPGPVDTPVTNVTADMQYFQSELRGRGYGYIELLKKHPLIFISLARQVQAELIAKAFAMANAGQLDVVHIYTNEEDIALPFVQLCNKPVVLTHHDPFNFLVRYKNTFPKYKHLNWISISLAQRQGMPDDANWVGNIHHGLATDRFSAVTKPGAYIAYLGRIIEAKGVHLAIAAVQACNRTANKPLVLRIAGKHYAGHNDSYWRERIEPHIDNKTIIYDGFLATDQEKQLFLGNASALVVPSIFDEPFGMVAIEALACGTPVIGLDSGALPEIIQNDKTGFVAKKGANDNEAIRNLSKSIGTMPNIRRQDCRADFETRFTLQRMCRKHLQIYKKLTA